MATAMTTGRDDQEQARAAVEQLLLAIGEDTTREGLLKTPERVAKAMEFLNSGASKSSRDVLNGAIFSESYRGLVLVQDIEFYSLSEHHMLPFTGKAHIAYLPQGKVIGLSKLPGLLDVFARRLQVQERLTEQVAAAVQEAIRPRGVAVMLEAVHFCMMMRGVEKQQSKTTTTSWPGAFERDSSLRQEFLASVRGVATEAHRRGPREVMAPGNAAVVPFPVTGEERKINVHAGRPRTTRKGGTYPRRQAISAPRGAFDGELGTR